MIEIKESVKQMEPYKPPLENRTNTLRFDFNENTLGPSPKVLNLFRKVEGSYLASYPEYAELKTNIAEYAGVNSENVILTNGSDEAINLLISSTIGKDDKVIIISPTFQMFKFYAQIQGANIVNLNYKKDFTFPTEKALNTINEKTRLVILCNPNNPTGSIIQNKDIEKIARRIVNGVVLVDEAYYEFSKQTAINLLNKYENILITRTFSKAFGLAGLRLGYLIGNEKLIALLQRGNSPYNVNSLAVRCGIVALNDIDYIENYVKEVNQSKKLLYKFLDEKQIKFYKSATNFVLIKFGKQTNYVFEQLKKTKILVRNVSKQPLLEGCLRITVGTTYQTKYFLQELEKILSRPVLIFDLDGVLVDVSQSYRTAIKKTAEYFTKKKVSFSEIQNFKEKGGLNNDWDLTEAIISDKGIDVPKNKIIQKFQEYYLGKEKLINKEKWLLSRNRIKKLSEEYKLAIVTGRPKQEAVYALKKFGFEEYFETIVTLDDIPEGKEKPNPFSLKLALKKMGAEEGIYVGDSIDDAIAAKRARIEFIGVLPPKTKSKTLERLMKKNGATKVFKKVRELVIE
jgi:histidinol-phosphate aminotransferase